VKEESTGSAAVFAAGVTFEVMQLSYADWDRLADRESESLNATADLLNSGEHFTVDLQESFIDNGLASRVLGRIARLVEMVDSDS